MLTAAEYERTKLAIRVLEAEEIPKEQAKGTPPELVGTMRARVVQLKAEVALYDATALLQAWSDAGMWDLSPTDIDVSRALLGNDSAANHIRAILGAYRNGNSPLSAIELARHVKGVLGA